MSSDETPGSPEGYTSLHIARARGGSAESIGWVVERFTPFLQMQARQRLQGPIARVCSEQDLSHDVWLRVIPHLGDLRPREGRWTPVLLRYLGTTLLRRANDLYRTWIRRGNLPSSGWEDDRSPLEGLPAEVTNVLTRATRSEVGAQVLACLDRLSAPEREVFSWRVMEELGNREVAARLGEKESATSMRFRRTLEKLRACMPPGLLDELGE